MSLSDTLETRIINYLRGTALITPPAQLFLSLHTADPGETGTSEHSTATGAYARQPVALTAPPSPVSNTALVQFPQATADYAAPTTHVGIWDAATGGTFLVGGALGASRQIRNGDIPQFGAGSVVFTLD